MAKTILLADDSVTIRKVVELTFMDEDYEVVAVASGDEALAQLDASNPDIIIADIHMPGAGGYEVCRTAKSKRPGVPVMLLVGTFEQFDEQDVAACGAETFLKKPFDSQELLRMVDDLLAAAPEPEPAAPETDASFSFDDETPSSLVAPPMEADELPADLDEAPVAFELEEPAFAESEGGEATDSDEGFGNGGAFEAPTFEEPSFGEPTLEEPSFDAPSVEQEAAEEDVAPSFDEPSIESEPLDEPMVGDAEAEPFAQGNADEEEEAAAAAFEPGEGGEMSEEDVDRIARRVVEYLTDDVVRDLAWEILPDLAEVIVKARLRELEGEAE